jgi:probable phosphoglycerate mutase
MLSLYLIRHGHTQHSDLGCYCGSGCDAELTESGHAMARAIANHLGSRSFAALYASPQRRAVQTAAPLAAATGLAVVEEAALEELDYGAWDGLTPADLREREPDAFKRWIDNPADHAPPGGETARDVIARVVPLVDRIRARHRTGNVALVAHKSTLRILACDLLDIDVAQYRDRVQQPLASITLLEVGETSATAVRVGDTSHLPPDLRAMAG